MTVVVLIVAIVWAMAFLADLKAFYPKTRPLVRWVCIGAFALSLAVQCLYELGVPLPSVTQALTGFVAGTLNLK